MQLSGEYSGATQSNETCINWVHLYGFIAGLLLPASAQVPQMPQHVRTRIESILGAKGTYVPDEGAFRLRLPRTDIFPRMRGQRGYSVFPPQSWAAFGPAVHE